MNTKAIAAAACLWVPVAASAADDQSNASKMDTLSKRFEQMLATQGISIGGQFRGEYGGAEFSGNSLDRSRRNDEQIGFTSVDFDLRAKPNSVTQARAVFRMHMDHASFFGSPYTPLETRWLSIDGSALEGMLYYHLGNQLQKWSPLTMWAPEVGYLYTPRIFAQAQKTAMDERFLGNNYRNLQGVNLGFRAAIPGARIDSFDVSGLVARLLMASPIGTPESQYLSSYNVAKKSGAGGWPTQLANYDRILLGGRTNWAFLGGIQVGANFLQNKDLKSTFGVIDTLLESERTKTTYIHPGRADSIIYPTSRPKDSLITNGIVASGMLKVDGAKLMGHSNLILGLDVEFANSNWDHFEHTDVITSRTDTATTGVDSLGVVTEITKKEIGGISPTYKANSGSALNLGIKAGWKGDAWSAALRLGYLKNDSLFRSDLAQTPTFNKQFGRVYNSEQDVYAGGAYAKPVHYNLFDAMYHNVHHWIAEEKNEYSKNAYDKLAYTNYVAGSAQYPFSNLTVALPGLKRDVDSGIVRYARAKIGYDTTFSKYVFKVDSTKALAVKTSADSIALGLVKRGTVAQRTFTDSAVYTKTAEYKKNVDQAYIDNIRKTKTALYQKALDGFQLDRDMQYMLPGGEASANRVGVKFGWDLNFEKIGLEYHQTNYLLEEAKGTILDSANQNSATKAKFLGADGGLVWRADRLFPNWNRLMNPKAPLPLELTSTVKACVTTGGEYLKYTSVQTGVGLYVGIVPRLSLLLGRQQVIGDDKSVLEIDRNYTNTAGGLEFKIQEGAYFLAQYNQLKTEYPNATEFDFTQDIWSTKISVSF